MTFDFSCVDWSDDDSSPFDQCESSTSSCDTVSLSSSASFASRTPKIRFAQEDEVFEVLHVNDYSEEDINATWYRPGEFREMRSQLQLVVLEMEANDLAAESDSFTRRGLEFRTCEGGLKRSRHKREASAAVLEEQQRLWREGREDPEQIAASYKIVSAKCLGMALLQGIQDQHDVRDYVHGSLSCPSATSDADETSPSKPYESPRSSRRLAVLEDIKILSGASELELWPASPAAA